MTQQPTFRSTEDNLRGFGPRAGNFVRDHTVNPILRRTFGSLRAGSVPSAAWLGGIGALAGGSAAVGANMLRRDGAKISPLRAALALGVVGGGLGVAGSHLYRSGMRGAAMRNHLKKASFLNPISGTSVQADKDYIISRLMSASDLNENVRRHMVSLIRSLQPAQASQLSGLLRTSVGAAVGYLVGRFLLNLNLGGTLLATFMGGLAFGSTGGRSGPKNQFSQKIF